MKRILTYGTYDLLHFGHINLLKRAKDLGDYLVVGLSTDEFNGLKGKESYFSYENSPLYSFGDTPVIFLNLVAKYCVACILFLLLLYLSIYGLSLYNGTQKIYPDRDRG